MGIKKCRGNHFTLVGIAPARTRSTAQAPKQCASSAQVGGACRASSGRHLLGGFVVGQQQRGLRLLELDLLRQANQPRNVTQYRNHRNHPRNAAPGILFAEGEAGHQGVLRLIALPLGHRRFLPQHPGLLEFLLSDGGTQPGRSVYHPKTTALLGYQSNQRHRRRRQVVGAGDGIAVRVLCQRQRGHRSVASGKGFVGTLRARGAGRT